MKLIEFDARIAKIMQNLIIPFTNQNKNEIPRIPRQNNANHFFLNYSIHNHENYEIHRIPNQKNESHENLFIPLQNS